MKRLLTWALKRRYIRRFPNAHLIHFERQLAAANSSPFAAWLSFSDEVTDIGLVTDWGGMVKDLEAEGSWLIGAVPCPAPHGAGGTFPPEVEMTNIIPSGCPACGAAV